jgi:hypothetical protein
MRVATGWDGIGWDGMGWENNDAIVASLAHSERNFQRLRVYCDECL